MVESVLRGVLQERRYGMYTWLLAALKLGGKLFYTFCAFDSYLVKRSLSSPSRDGLVVFTRVL